MAIYIFYLDNAPKKASGNMHGGNAYSKRVIQLLIKSGCQVSLLIPEGYKAIDLEEEEIFHHNNVTLVERSELNAGICLEENSILFFPLLRGKNLGLLKSFKEKNKNLKIYITVHGLRLLDLVPDKYDKYYYTGIRYYTYGWLSKVLYFVKCNIYKKVISEKLKYADKIFTVSNYSMKQIISYVNPVYIKPYYCGTNFKLNGLKKEEKERNYFLFVSAKRQEKNFLRTLEAFIKHKKEKRSDFFLYVTGLDQRTKKLLSRYKEWDENYVNKWVVFFDYVDSDKLEELYENSAVVLYTSKSECFGLPAV